MNPPLTPKIHNCSKRRIQQSSTDELHHLHDFIDCQALQRSLKRMKVTSASPGELRLQRDLKHAMHSKGWLPVKKCGGNSWKVPYGCNYNEWITVRQSPEDPLQLLFLLDDWTVWLDVPRLYPHRPPAIRLHHDQHQSRMLVQATPEDLEAQAAARNGTVVLQGWTPLSRLDEIIQLIVPVLQTHRTPPQERDNRDSMMMMDDNAVRSVHAEADCATEMPRQRLLFPTTDELSYLFPPNRFDLGYGRPPVDCNSMMMQE
jgi:ubiquitin-protein ligase